MNDTNDAIGAVAHANGDPVPAVDDPWSFDDQLLERRDNWLLSYIDILTLFLTLLVVLLALQPKEEAPMAETQPGDHRFITPIPIERSPQNSVSRATEIGKSTMRWPATGLVEGEQQAGNQSAVELPGIPLVSQISFNPLRLGFPDEGIPLMEDLPQPAVLVEQTRNEKAPVDDATEPVGEKVTEAQRLVDELMALELDQELRISQVAEGVQLEVSDSILFALGSTELKAEGRALLDNLYQVLSSQLGNISIEGHSDDRPIANSRFPSNWELSSGRATQVARYLISKGMQPARMRAIGYADTRPLESNASAAGRSRNRRVALLVELPEPASHD